VALALSLGQAVLLAAPANAETEARAPAIIYLNFSDGTEEIHQGSSDSSDANRSAIGKTSAYPAFDWTHVVAGADRDAVVHEVAQAVDDAFRPYNVLVSTVRPTAPGYGMVMIGGGPADLGLPPQVAGVALLDCDNHEAGNVAFAFSDNLDGVHGLWVTIAQEAAHTFGLEHTDDFRDVMYPRSAPSQVGFLDEEETVVTPICGPLLQSSHQKLRRVLGDWPGGDKTLVADVAELPAGSSPELATTGCAMAGGAGPGSTARGLLAPALFFVIFACARRRSHL
jgi:hypothetical protein